MGHHRRRLGGVGVAFARQLGEAGINLVLIARQKPLLEQLAHEVGARSGVQTRVLVLDLARTDTLERVREVTHDIEVGLLVFNAAASTGIGYFLDATLERVVEAVRLGPLGYASLAHHFGGRMAARHRGGIILIGSLAGNAGAATRTPARERVALKDSPDQFVAEPEDVARECLDNLANGPVLVPAHLEEGFRMFSSMPRRQAAETMTRLLLSFRK